MPFRPVGSAVNSLLIGKRPLAFLFEMPVMRLCNFDALILEVECVTVDPVADIGNELCK